MKFYLMRLKKINNDFRTCNKFSKVHPKTLFSITKIIRPFTIILLLTDLDKMNLSTLLDNQIF